jgi:hypothetical protein
MQHQATALADTPLVAIPTSAPSQPHVDAPGPAMPMAMEFFLDPVSGWACWIPRWPPDAELGAEDDSLDGRRRQAGNRGQAPGPGGRLVRHLRADPVGRLAADPCSPPRPLGARRASLPDPLDLVVLTSGRPWRRQRPPSAVGPVISPPPTGVNALALWDALVALAAVPGFYELSCPRLQGLALPQPAGSGLGGTQGHIPRRS